MIVIGLGSGRTGTASLAQMISMQSGATCFHELNPACAVHSGNPQSITNTIREFLNILDGGDRRLLTVDYSRPPSVTTYQEMVVSTEQPKILGDIAHYYLNYVEEILALSDRVRFVCIKRAKEETVESWMRKTRFNRWASLKLADRLKSLITRMPYPHGVNHWQDHDGITWENDPVWDSCFPKFKAATKRQAIELYWDYYYEIADSLANRCSKKFRIFDISSLSSKEGQMEILSFIGINEGDMVLFDEVHIHKSSNA